MPRAYSLKRARERQRLASQTADRIAKRMDRIVLRASDECEEAVSAWLGRYADREGITLGEARKVADSTDVEALARKAELYVRERDNKALSRSPQADAEMRRYNYTMRLNREELLRRRIDLNLTTMASDLTGILGDELEGVALDELKELSGILGDTIPSVEELRARAEILANASYQSTDFSALIWDNQEALRSTLHKGLTDTLLRGRNPMAWGRDLSKLMTSAFTGSGTNLGGMRYASRRIAITEAARVMTSAQRDAYQRAGYETYEIVAELRPSTCEICANEWHGLRFKLLDMEPGVNAPPFHPNCYCSTVPYYERERVDSAIEDYELLSEALRED